MATKELLRPFFKEIYAKSNFVVELLLMGYFVFGIGLSFFYDTYLVGFGVVVEELDIFDRDAHADLHATILPG